MPRKTDLYFCSSYKNAVEYAGMLQRSVQKRSRLHPDHLAKSGFVQIDCVSGVARSVRKNALTAISQNL